MSDLADKLNIEEFAASMGLRNIALVMGLFDTYFTGLPDNLAQIEKSAADCDCVRLREAAHSLKGSSANLQLKGIASLAESIEKAAARGEVAKTNIADLAAMCAATSSLYSDTYNK